MTPFASLTEIAPTRPVEDRAARMGLLGESPIMKAVFAKIEKLAASDLPVLIRGETGTGKELAARALHELSPRRGGPFVSENCAALAEGVLEAELFGHERGSFTGAEATRDGLFQRASGGTLFIDEVGDMSPSLQAKLLRVLETGEVRRLGAGETERVDVRVLAATHRNLDELVRDGRFRADLVFRLHVLEVTMPPLRDRKADVPILVERFLERLATPARRAPVLSEGALDALLAHDWPGNVRELENAVRVAALFSPGSVVEQGALPIPTARSSAQLAAEAAVLGARGQGDARLSYDDLRAALDERERRFVTAVLDEEGNKARAARRLGITRYALYRVLKRLGIVFDDASLEAAL